MKRQYICSQNLDKEIQETVERELNLGFFNLSEDFFEQAKINFQLAKEYDPHCPDAYWGLMLCELNLSNEDGLYSNPMANKSATSLTNCQKALEYADETLRKKYEDLLERINKINEGDKF